MRNPISQETLLKAEEAARQLKERLRPRIIGQQCGAFSCNCGASHQDVAEAVDITYHGARSQYASMVGQFMHWGVNMKEIGSNPSGGYSYGLGITQFISWSQLYPMFRNIFEPIGVPVNHPHGRGYYDHRQPGQQPLNRSFHASGRVVVTMDGEAALVRPSGDLTISTWVAAEIRVDSNVPRYQNHGPLAACNVDPFGAYDADFAHSGLEAGDRFAAGKRGVDEQLTFYVYIGDQHVNLPIARLVAFDAQAGSHTFELDQSVETCQSA